MGYKALWCWRVTKNLVLYDLMSLMVLEWRVERHFEGTYGDEELRNFQVDDLRALLVLESFKVRYFDVDDLWSLMVFVEFRDTLMLMIWFEVLYGVWRVSRHFDVDDLMGLMGLGIFWRVDADDLRNLMVLKSSRHFDIDDLRGLMVLDSCETLWCWWFEVPYGVWWVARHFDVDDLKGHVVL